MEQAGSGKTESPTVAVIERKLKKYKKKLEAIKRTKDKKDEGKDLNEDQKQLISAEPELLRMIDELDSVKRELEKIDEDSKKGGEIPPPSAETSLEDIAPGVRFAYVLSHAAGEAFAARLMQSGLSPGDLQNVLSLHQASCGGGYEGFAKTMMKLVKQSAESVGAVKDAPDYKAVCTSLETAAQIMEKMPPPAAPKPQAPAQPSGARADRWANEEIEADRAPETEPKSQELGEVQRQAHLPPANNLEASQDWKGKKGGKEMDKGKGKGKGKGKDGEKGYKGKGKEDKWKGKGSNGKPDEPQKD